MYQNHGGLREKSMAALRSGIKTVIIPAANEQDIDEFSQAVRTGIHFVPVRTVDDVFRTAFAKLPSPNGSEKQADAKREEKADSAEEAESSTENGQNSEE